MTDFSIAVLITAAGLLLSLNPFSISVFAALLAGIRGKDTIGAKTFFRASSYMASYFLLISVAGVIFAELFNLAPQDYLIAISVATAALVIIIGITAARYYFWHQTKNNIPSDIKVLLHSRTVKNNNPSSALLLGLGSAIVSLATIGGVMLALASITTLAGSAYSNWFMLLFAFCLITPLIFIYFFTASGLKISAILKWKEESQAVMYLSIGLVNIVAGWLVLLLVNGSIESIL